MGKPKGQPVSFKDLRKVMKKSGWYIARQTNHEVWRCSCGEHQTVLPKTASDHRGVKNKVSELRKLGCPDLKHLWK